MGSPLSNFQSKNKLPRSTQADVMGDICFTNDATLGIFLSELLL